MALIDDVVDWPTLVEPLNQVFRSGGSVISGGSTLGGIAISNIEPGGRGVVDMSFATMTDEDRNVEASYAMTQILAGRTVSLQLSESVQLFPAAAMTVTGTTNTAPWSNDENWSNSQPWLLGAYINIQSGLEGSRQLTLDTTDFLDHTLIKRGHVFGIEHGSLSFTHIVDNVAVSGTTMTLTVSPPLRRTVAANTRLSRIPTMYAQCTNASEVGQQYEHGRHVSLGSAKFVEVLF